MQDFKLFSQCAGCRKKRWLIRKTVLKIAGARAASRDLFCRTCINSLKRIKTT